MQSMKRVEDGRILLKETNKVSIDDFNLMSVLGRGSYGKVLIVNSKNTGELYAIKVIKKKSYNTFK